MATSSIESVRRYYLLKRLYARRLDDDSESVWKAKQQSVIGTLLPAEFPSLVALVGAGYSTVEDLYGADATELIEQAKLSRIDAAIVLAALAAL